MVHQHGILIVLGRILKLGFGFGFEKRTRIRIRIRIRKKNFWIRIRNWFLSQDSDSDSKQNFSFSKLFMYYIVLISYLSYITIYIYWNNYVCITIWVYFIYNICFILSSIGILFILKYLRWNISIYFYKYSFLYLKMV